MKRRDCRDGYPFFGLGFTKLVKRFEQRNRKRCYSNNEEDARENMKAHYNAAKPLDGATFFRGATPVIGNDFHDPAGLVFLSPPDTETLNDSADRQCDRSKQ